MLPVQAGVDAADHDAVALDAERPGLVGAHERETRGDAARRLGGVGRLARRHVQLHRDVLQQRGHLGAGGQPLGQRAIAARDVDRVGDVERPVLDAGGRELRAQRVLARVGVPLQRIEHGASFGGLAGLPCGGREVGRLGQHYEEIGAAVAVQPRGQASVDRRGAGAAGGERE